MNAMLAKGLNAALAAIAGADEVGDDEMLAALRAAVLAMREPEAPQRKVIARLTAGHGPDGYVTPDQAAARWAELIDTLLA